MYKQTSDVRSGSGKNQRSASFLGEKEQPSNPSTPPKSLSVDEPSGRLRTPPPPKITASAEAAKNHTLKKRPQTPVKYDMAAAFDSCPSDAREPPEMPSTTDIEYPRAASWASGTLENLIDDPKGKQLFRVFLHSALAEENLHFVDAIGQLKKVTDPGDRKKQIENILALYAPYINISATSMQKIKEAAASDNPDQAAFDPALKEVRRLLENDQFPRFRRSDLYIGFLEKLLPLAYAQKWTSSFDALLGNQIGRHHFRLFLRSIHAEENLRFWEAVVEFRYTKNKSAAMVNMGKTIMKTYLVEGTQNEVFLPFGVRQLIQKRIAEKDVDQTLFDEAVKHVEQVLRNDPYVRFLQSHEYADLLNKLER